MNKRLKTMPDFKISKNDIALAHGTAKYLADCMPMAEFLHRIMTANKIGKLSVKTVEGLMNPQIRKYLFDRIIGRENGSRARACWFFLAPLHTHFNVVRVSIEKQRLHLKDLGLQVSHHTFARVLQRGSGTSDVASNVLLMRDHIYAVLDSIKKASPELKEQLIGDNVMEAITYTPSGKLIWETAPGESMIVSKTFVDIPQYHQEDIDYSKTVSASKVAIIWRTFES